MNERWRRKLDDKEEYIRNMEQRVGQMEQLLRHKEEEGFKRGNEQEKLMALLEQKLQLTESELAEYKGKYG